MEESLKNIFWLGHASFKIKDQASGNLIYYIDPFELKLPSYEKADLIFITHAHFDHCSKEDIDKIIKSSTVVVAPIDCFHNLGLTVQYEKKEVVPNQNYELKGIKFRTVPAYNIKPERLTFHPRKNNWVGYILTVNGRTIYHAGDTDFIPEMKSFGKSFDSEGRALRLRLEELRIDIAMLPIGGTYTMDVNEAIKAANVISTKLTIPMHYKRLLGEKYKEAEERFKAEVTNSKVVILEEVSSSY